MDTTNNTIAGVKSNTHIFQPFNRNLPILIKTNSRNRQAKTPVRHMYNTLVMVLARIESGNTPPSPKAHTKSVTNRTMLTSIPHRSTNVSCAEPETPFALQNEKADSKMHIMSTSA